MEIKKYLLLGTLYVLFLCFTSCSPCILKESNNMIIMKFPDKAWGISFKKPMYSYKRVYDYVDFNSENKMFGFARFYAFINNDFVISFNLGSSPAFKNINDHLVGSYPETPIFKRNEFKKSDTILFNGFPGDCMVSEKFQDEYMGIKINNYHRVYLLYFDDVCCTIYLSKMNFVKKDLELFDDFITSVKFFKEKF